MTQIDYKRFAGIVIPSRRDEANAAVASVNGNFENLFKIPCNEEDDPDTTIRQYGTGSTLTKPEERREARDAVQKAGISAPDLRYGEVKARQGERWQEINEFDLFIAQYQLKRIIEGGFVYSTGLLRNRNPEGSQIITDQPQLINQWDSTEYMLNSTLDGTGTRLQTVYGGSYYLETRIPFVETGDTFRMRLTKNTDWLTPHQNFTTSPITGSINISNLLPEDKLGISIEVASGVATFQMTGGWFGMRRTGR